ncbi:DsrE family protein [Ideonella sp. YS5]|uniref:DsrE family protein n=1 Tax=Ideonella sp. YS5 TaxID=3453714 RepID=UPI003EEE8080
MYTRRWLAALLLLLASGWAVAQDKVVYHVSDSQAQALPALRNLRNHLDVDPTAQITVVTLGAGVDFLMEDAKEEKSGTAYAPLVSALRGRGVKFEVCEITLKNRGLKRDQFIQEADFTPSGVVRLSKLQIQGYAYIRP